MIASVKYRPDDDVQLGEIFDDFLSVCEFWAGDAVNNVGVERVQLDDEEALEEEESVARTKMTPKPSRNRQVGRGDVDVHS